MTLEDIIKMCKSRDWNAMQSFLSSNVKEIYPRLLVAAVFETYCPNPIDKQKFGLKRYEKLLSQQKVSLYGNLLTDAIDLVELTRAYQLAATPSELNDPQVAKEIHKFVNANKPKLANILFSPEMDASSKEAIIKIFGEFNLTKAEKESYFCLNFEKRNSKLKTAIVAKEKVKKNLKEIFKLNNGEFYVSFPEGSSLEGMDINDLDSGGNINFKDKVTVETLEEMTEALKGMGISSNYFTMSGGGIQIESDPEKVGEKLEKFKNYNSSPVALVPNSFFTKAKQHLESFQKVVQIKRAYTC